MCVLMCVIGCARSWDWVRRCKTGWKCVLLYGGFLQHQHEYKSLLGSCTINSAGMRDSKHTVLYLLYLLFEWNKRWFSTKSFIMIQVMMRRSCYVIMVVKPVYWIFSDLMKICGERINFFSLTSFLYTTVTQVITQFLTISSPRYFAIFFGLFSLS